MKLVLVGDGHGARRAGADDPPGCHQGSVADPDRGDEGGSQKLKKSVLT